MTISKAVELLMKFVDANSDAKIETKEDCDKVDNDLEKFIRSKHKNTPPTTVTIEPISP